MLKTSIKNKTYYKQYTNTVKKYAKSICGISVAFLNTLESKQENNPIYNQIKILRT